MPSFGDPARTAGYCADHRGVETGAGQALMPGRSRPACSDLASFTTGSTVTADGGANQI